jgi:hypothetical protein
MRRREGELRHDGDGGAEGAHEEKKKVRPLPDGGASEEGLRVPWQVRGRAPRGTLRILPCQRRGGGLRAELSSVAPWSREVHHRRRERGGAREKVVTGVGEACRSG